jgi:cell division protein FtsB
MHKEKSALLDKSRVLVMENTKIYNEIERLKNDPAYVEQLARKELGMVRADELIFRRKPSGPANTKPKQ